MERGNRGRKGQQPFEERRDARSRPRAHQNIQSLQLRLRLRSESLNALQVHQIQDPGLASVSSSFEDLLDGLASRLERSSADDESRGIEFGEDESCFETETSVNPASTRKISVLAKERKTRNKEGVRETGNAPAPSRHDDVSPRQIYTSDLRYSSELGDEVSDLAFGCHDRWKRVVWKREGLWRAEKRKIRNGRGFS